MWVVLPACSPAVCPGLKAKDAWEEPVLQKIDGALCAEVYQKALKKNVLTPLSEKVPMCLAKAYSIRSWLVFCCIEPV